MRRRDTYWSLYHRNEKRQIDDLKTDSIETIFEVLPAKDRRDWLLWREGFTQWKPFEDFPKLLSSLRKGGLLEAPSSPAPAPALARETHATSPKKETTVQDRLARQGSLDSEVDLDLMADAELGERAVRYPKKWAIRILTDGKPITNTTVDVSNRGMSLKDPLPKGLPHYFNVEIQAGDVMIPLVCSEVKSTINGPSSRIRIEVNHSPNVLQTALLS